MGVVLAFGALLSTVMRLGTVSIVGRASDTNYEKLPLLGDMAGLPKSKGRLLLRSIRLRYIVMESRRGGGGII